MPTWRSRTASATRLRFLVTQNARCRFDVTYTVRSVLAADEDPPAHVLTGLPSDTRRLLDSGVHNGAFRVVHPPATGGRVLVEALSAGVLTRRPTVVALPTGQAAWSEIHVTAVERAGDECHTGTYRDALGPAIGDSLAVAKTRLRFVAPVHKLT